MFTYFKDTYTELFPHGLMHLGIRFKLIAAFSIMIIPIFLLGFVSQRLTSKSIEERVILSTSETIEQTAKLLDMVLLNVKDEYIKILASSQVQDYYNYQVSEDDETSGMYKNTLKSIANNYLTNRVLSSSIISNIWIIVDRDNSLGTKFLPIQFDYSRVDKTGWYQKSMDEKSRLTVFGRHSELDNADAAYAMSLIGSIKRIIGKSFINKSVGVMVIDIDFDFILSILSGIDLGKRGEIHIISADGRDISAFGTGILSDLSVDSVLSGILLKKEDAGNTIVKYNGENYHLTYTTIGNTGLTILGLQPESEMFATARSINLWTLSLILFAIGTSIVLGLLLTFGIGGRISKFSAEMKKVAQGDLNICIPISGNDEIAVLGKGFNKMIGDLKQYVDESVENEKIKREMAINLLISQINPHLIYNTLNSVIYLAKEEKNEDIVRMVESFISLLQDSIRIGDEGIFATIKQEVESVKNYALIQKYRYPERFKIEWEIDEKLLGVKIPKTILQPLVENALFHGICPGEGQGVISIFIKKIEEHVRIVVEDNGSGMTSDVFGKIFDKGSTVNTSHLRTIGLSNIRDRIIHFYGTDGKIEIESVPNKGTKVKLHIPIQSL